MVMKLSFTGHDAIRFVLTYFDRLRINMVMKLSFTGHDAIRSGLTY